MSVERGRGAGWLSLRRVGGAFYRCVLAERAAAALDPPGPASAGRYHRPGQPTLYLSPRPDWAAIAVSGYAREDGRARVVVPLEVDAALVLDQHDEEACRRIGIDRERSNANWRRALADGAEPPSWGNADTVRAAGADGIVDRSRLIPGGWHVALFRWNGLGGPGVRIAGAATAVVLSTDGPHWGP